MSFTYDPASINTVGLIRLFADDTQTIGHVFEDEELSAFFGVEADVRLAAAMALEVLAMDKLRVQGKIELLDLKTHADDLAKSYLAIAKVLRDRVEETAGFDWIEQVTNSFTERERIYKQFLRGAI
jgi:hypothetical protein